MLKDVLLSHAIRSIWCAPAQDSQYIFRPVLINGKNGSWNIVTILNDTYNLPEPAKRFYVYQVGQLHPDVLGLFPIQNKWVNLADCCNGQKMLIDVYSIDGYQLPRFQTWYRVTEDRNLIFAILEQPTIPVKQGFDDVYFRVYTNNWFVLNDPVTDSDSVLVAGGVPKTTAQILSLQLKYEELLKLPGHVHCFVNGFRVKALDLLNVRPGDVVEYVYDSSIYKIVEWNIKTLETFDSFRDQKSKYLLHYSGGDAGHIDFQDDVDIFIVLPNGKTSKGVYYHHNFEDSIRNVTHRDYSLVVMYVLNILSKVWPNEDPSKFVIRAHIRKGANYRPLADEHNRIKELYKLKEPEIKQALLGINSQVTNWRADVLENSEYVKMMGIRLRNMTTELVEKAYGYNAISRIIANTPVKIPDGAVNPVIDVPYGLQYESTGYEYDADGKLLLSSPHYRAQKYGIRDSRTKLVELICGLGSDRLVEYYGDREVTLNPEASYRMYRCNKEGGMPDESTWEDVTDSGEYAIINGKLKWINDPDRYYTLVRSDSGFLAYEIDLPITDGLLQFSLAYYSKRFGVNQKYIMRVPMGELSLWMNGNALINGLDYHVDFPRIVITNKEYLDKGFGDITQRIAIRFTGFCTKLLELQTVDEFGFVKYGVLSRNNRFDIRDDKVMSFVVGGATRHFSDLVFSEDNPFVSAINSRNGQPYVIRDIIVPLRSIAKGKTYEMREQSRIVDKAISDYMTLKLPEPDFSIPSVIPKKYQLFSPFLTAIIDDLLNGRIDDEPLYQHYNDDVIASICKPYMWLLKSDPTQDANFPDPECTVIHPLMGTKVIEVRIHHYAFLERVIKTFLNSRVTLSGFLKIKNEGLEN